MSNLPLSPAAPSVASSPLIEGVFVKQRYDSSDQHHELDRVRFDATATVLELSLEDINALVDSDYTTDLIGLEHVEHDGPFEVYVTENICAFFGVADVEDITPAMLEDARREFAARPPQTFAVHVTRTSFAVRTLEVLARTPAEARRLALDEAGNHLYTEHSASYQADEPRPSTTDSNTSI